MSFLLLSFVEHHCTSLWCLVLAAPEARSFQLGFPFWIPSVTTLMLQHCHWICRRTSEPLARLAFRKGKQGTRAQAPGFSERFDEAVSSRGRCNTSHKKRGEVYGQETKEQADEEAAMVHSDRAGRGVGSLAAGGVVPIDRTRAGQRGDRRFIVNWPCTGASRPQVPLPVIAGTDSGRT